jgi:hypothetical protein
MVRWWLRICELSGGNGSRRLSASHSRDLVIGERGDDLSERSCSDSLELVWPRPGDGVSGGSCTGLLSPQICVEERDCDIEGANKESPSLDGGDAFFSKVGVSTLEGAAISAWRGVDGFFLNSSAMSSSSLAGDTTNLGNTFLIGIKMV